MGMIDLHLGDCLDVMGDMAENSIDTIITDPPYGLEFMGKDWDKLAGDFTETGGSGEWAAQHGTSRKGFDGYGPLPTYVGGGNIKCPNCGRPVDGRDPAKPNPRKGYRCICGGARRERQRLASAKMQEWHYQWAAAALRVAKPGAMMLAFGGTRTHHRLMCAIEDAGWQIRDCLMWLYGSGFPKSHDISKAIDKAAGAEREVVGQKAVSRLLPNDVPFGEGLISTQHDKPVVAGTIDITAPATPAAQLWHGWGTSLKPAFEPIVLCMKPREGTFAQNALTWGCAGLAIDAARIPTNGGNESWASGAVLCDSCAEVVAKNPKLTIQAIRASIAADNAEPITSVKGEMPPGATNRPDIGCSVGPCQGGLSDSPNVKPSLSTGECGKIIMDQSQRGTSSTISTETRQTTESIICILCGVALTSDITTKQAATRNHGRWPANLILDEQAGAMLDAQSGELTSGGGNKSRRGYSRDGQRKATCYGTYAAPSPDIRQIDTGGASRFFYCAKASKAERGKDNGHPTVKPLALMQYLCQLTKTPTGGVVLDPFMGSGSTGIAAIKEGREFVGIEIDEEYMEIAKRRLEWAQERANEPHQLELMGKRR